jgi:hypothetical protein
MSEIVKLGVERKIHKLIKEAVAEEAERVSPDIRTYVWDAVNLIITRCREPIEKGDG